MASCSLVWIGSPGRHSQKNSKCMRTKQINPQRRQEHGLALGWKLNKGLSGKISIPPGDDPFEDSHHRHSLSGKGRFVGAWLAKCKCEGEKKIPDAVPLYGSTVWGPCLSLRAMDPRSAEVLGAGYVGGCRVTKWMLPGRRGGKLAGIRGGGLGDHRASRPHDAPHLRFDSVSRSFIPTYAG